MFLKKDNIQLGIILGLLAPFAGMLGFYFWRFRRLTIVEFIQFLAIEKHLISAMLSFSLLANAIVFTIYINTRKDKTARGIFAVTVIYAIGVLLLKLFY
ncbi:MAG: hypothetical protein GTN67_10685 [Hydrotalea flava]|uniref:hypothetical protein n=1 Tax=Hydrotalea TaxID=1004300 RepID=UPI000945A0B6|nr:MULTISPECIES: hypothetical protein [Hydrotalea]MBY0347238.1 hypothetical protein [Hydrotalea flava]NIM35811.1 hypothetical protein [Hydrotalea flava]NIM38663.1 hypothetical protein [Hydrotalea flava]NIN03851.1 hypothetical protein [Hydrotalea flava]NIN15572.1 hypothetical protein [Hydrotalea flava]